MERVVASSLTNTCIGQISAVTFCAKTRTKAANKNLLVEAGVSSCKVHLLYASFHNYQLSIIFAIVSLGEFGSPEKTKAL